MPKENRVDRSNPLVTISTVSVHELLDIDRILRPNKKQPVFPDPC